MFDIVEAQTSDSSSFRVFFTGFCLIYLFSYHVVFRNWSPNHRPAAASCFISLAHGTPATMMAASAILSQSNRGFASPNTHFENLVLDFSIAYFVVDLLHYVIFIPGDYLFIGHHVATLFVFLTCRHIAFHGAFSLLVLLFIAEVTSACQNVWTLAAMRKADSPLAAKIHDLLAPPFYTLYTLARVIAGPLFFFKMTSFYLKGEGSDVISWWVSLSWIVVVGGAICVGILWIFNNWLELCRERKIQSFEEKKTI